MERLKNLRKLKAGLLLCLFIFCSIVFRAQEDDGIKWSNKGSSYFTFEDNELVEHMLPGKETKILISKAQLTPKGGVSPLTIDHYSFSADNTKVLLFTNTKKVWRINSKGDYWVLDLKTNTLTQLGKKLPVSSLQFAKFSPDGKYVAYVSENNIYAEELSTSEIKKLTNNGTTSLINGTFDWAYEEEFANRDGFRWSPDSRSIAYWQIDASGIKKFNMINYTDSIHSQVISFEYPKVGDTPSACKAGVVTVADAKTTWMKLPGDPAQHYIVRLEFIPGTNTLLTQQLNRKQNESRLFISDAANGNSKMILEEKDQAWIEIYEPENPYTIDFTNHFIWLNNGKSILWTSEKDGWRHLYNISLEGKPDQLITKGNYDFTDLKFTEEKKGYVYFMASPDNATQKYLYRTKLDGSGKLESMSPASEKGTHEYSFSADGQYAEHTFSNSFTRPLREIISVADHRAVGGTESIAAALQSSSGKSATEFFKVTTKDGVEMDGWMVKPKDFDPKKKYPVVFYVYTEPAGATVNDKFGVSHNFLYWGDMAKDGYIYMSLDNRGTPAPKGRAWRKAIYRKIGQVNIRDQAMAAEEILKWDFVDKERVAVWGWSGGGSATLNLLFQYPDIYKTGIAVAAVANLLTYDNIYEERFMGLPQENLQDFIDGSPITYAKNLKGNLLYIHGTADDNVHYQNAEMLLNELIKYNKQFQFMPYPNRTHNVSEGDGTFLHLMTLYTSYLKKNCPPGGK